LYPSQCIEFLFLSLLLIAIFTTYICCPRKIYVNRSLSLYERAKSVDTDDDNDGINDSDDDDNDDDDDDNDDGSGSTNVPADDDANDDADGAGENAGNRNSIYVNLINVHVYFIAGLALFVEFR